jgi:ABC-type sugar transport system ATPase subunit
VTRGLSEKPMPGLNMSTNRRLPFQETALAAPEHRTFLTATGITKGFPGVVALKDINLDVQVSEIHAIVGENGAGKSTLIKILSGVYQPDRGELQVRGEHVTIPDPMAATRLGIATVPQESQLVPYLSVAENVFLGRLPKKRSRRVDVAERDRRAAELLRVLGCQLNVRAAVDGLSAAHAQMVTIARALAVEAKLLILDEPTASLSPNESAALFEVMQRLRSQGVSIIYISHRLDEVFKLADRITVLRDGRVIDTRPTAEANMGQVVTMMVGRPQDELFVRSSRPDLGDEVLSVRKVSVGTVVRDVSLTVRRGEVVGLFGLVGSGRTELVRAIIGADSRTGGEIVMDGRTIRRSTVRRSVRAGMGLAPENRKRDGLIQLLSVRDNIMLSANALTGNPIYRPKRVRSTAQRFVERLGIKVARIDGPVGVLSGGNQQRVVIAKLLAAAPGVLILDEPTQGVDVGAKAEIYRLISDLLDNGLGVLLVSSDLPEVLGISDRVLVMREGEIVAHLSGAEATEDSVGRAAIGLAATPQQAGEAT